MRIVSSIDIDISIADIDAIDLPTPRPFDVKVRVASTADVVAHVDNKPLLIAAGSSVVIQISPHEELGLSLLREEDRPAAQCQAHIVQE